MDIELWHWTWPILNGGGAGESVEEWNSAEVPSRRSVANKSGVGEVDDSNTGELGERELVLVFSVL